jgi:hypothetical protein
MMVDAISGYEWAANTARELGGEHWDARHDSSLSSMNRTFVVAAARNSIAFWQHKKVAIALTTDAWSQTYK